MPENPGWTWPGSAPKPPRPSPEPSPEPCWTWPGSAPKPPRPSPEPAPESCWTWPWLCTKVFRPSPEPSPEPCWTWPGSAPKPPATFSETFFGTLLNLLRKAVEPDLALHQSLPDLLWNLRNLLQNLVEPDPAPAPVHTGAILGWRTWLNLTRRLHQCTPELFWAEDTIGGKKTWCVLLQILFDGRVERMSSHVRKGEWFSGWEGCLLTSFMSHVHWAHPAPSFCGISHPRNEQVFCIR